MESEYSQYIYWNKIDIFLKKVWNNLIKALQLVFLLKNKFN